MKTNRFKVIKILFLFILITALLPSKAIGQDKLPQNSKEEKTKLSRVFANVATGNSFSSLGNFTSIGTANNTLSASLFFLTKDYNVFNLKVSGGATNGIASIFEQGKLNSKVSLGGSYNFMLQSSSNAIVINETEKDLIKREIINEEVKYQKKIISLLSGSLMKDFKKDSLIVAKLRNSIKKELKSIGNLIDNITSINEEDKKKLLIAKRTTVMLLQAKVTEMTRELNKRKQNIDIEKYSEIFNTYTLSKSKKINNLKEKIKALEVKPVASSFSWVSFGYNATNDSFSLFDESLPLEDQVFRKNYITQSLFFSFTHQSNAKMIRGNKGRIDDYIKRQRVYISIGAKLDVTNNLSSLTEVELIDTKIVDLNSGRQEESRQKAFSGDYTEDLTSGSLFIDYYNFISKSEPFAIHVNPVISIRENSKPITSFQVGFLFPFKDKTKQSKIVNLEVFYRINDVFNTQGSTKTIINRNTIGLQVSFPFNI